MSKLALTRAGLSVVLLLYTTMLPQDGDGAIGTVMVFMAAVAAYVALLFIAVPLVIWSAIRREKLIEAGHLTIAIVAPLVVGGLVVLFSNFLP